MGAKATGEAKGIRGGENGSTEAMQKGEIEIEWLTLGGPEPIPPRENERNKTRPKVLKIHPTQNGRGRSPLYIGLQNLVSRGFFAVLKFVKMMEERPKMQFFRNSRKAPQNVQQGAAQQDVQQEAAPQNAQQEAAPQEMQQEAAPQVAQQESPAAGLGEQVMASSSESEDEKQRRRDQKSVERDDPPWTLRRKRRGDSQQPAASPQPRRIH